MNKLIVLIVVLVSFIGILSLDGFKRIIPNNFPVTYEDLKKKHDEKIALIAKIEKSKEAPPEEVQKVETPIFKVELTSDALKKGHDLYLKCIVCHGQLGEGKKSQNAPKVGGQFAWYVTAQLKKMKIKERVNAVMDPYISKLTDQDFSDLGEYISKLPW